MKVHLTKISGTHKGAEMWCGRTTMGGGRIAPEDEWTPLVNDTTCSGCLSAVARGAVAESTGEEQK